MLCVNLIALVKDLTQNTIDMTTNIQQFALYNGCEKIKTLPKKYQDIQLRKLKERAKQLKTAFQELIKLHCDLKE